MKVTKTIGGILLLILAEYFYEEEG